MVALDVIAQLRLLDSPRRLGFVRDLIEIFAADAPAIIASIRAAVAARDFAQLEQRAHLLKGSCSTLGAQQAADVCQRLELLGASEDLGAAPPLLEELQRAFERALATLRHIADAAPEQAAPARHASERV